jgi:hypothetical protein
MEGNKMSDNKKKILDMLAKGKISADEAYRLLDTIDTKESGREGTRRDSSASKGSDDKSKAKYLRVSITPSEERQESEHAERVNVRVPMSLVRAGLKLTSLIPPEALDKANKAMEEKGIHFDIRSIKPDDIESLIEAMGDMVIDIEGSHGEKVKVFVE